jgi:hypothetical protein
MFGRDFLMKEYFLTTPLPPAAPHQIQYKHKASRDPEDRCHRVIAHSRFSSS